VRGLIAWSVYGTDEIERHADTAERRILEDLVKQGGLASLDSGTANGDKPGSTGGLSPASTHDKAASETTERSESPTSSGLWGNFPNASPQPDVEGDAKRQRYPHLATEILCADYFQISETLWSDLPGLLGPIWDIILGSREEALGMPVIEGCDTPEQRSRLRAHVRYELERTKSERDEDDDKRREIIRGNWTRINGMLLTKRPTQVRYHSYSDSETLADNQHCPSIEQMFKFIQEIPSVVSRLVDRIDSPSIQDTILRLITCEEAGVVGVIEVGRLRYRSVIRFS
jgi:SIT4-associating protein SAP185/190